jgi:hypothetical protein
MDWVRVTAFWSTWKKNSTHEGMTSRTLCLRRRYSHTSRENFQIPAPPIHNGTVASMTLTLVARVRRLIANHSIYYPLAFWSTCMVLKLTRCSCLAFCSVPSLSQNKKSCVPFLGWKLGEHGRTKPWNNKVDFRAHGLLTSSLSCVL